MPESTSTTFLNSLTTENIQSWLLNFQQNAQTSVSRLQAKDYIRLIAIVGGYCLLRPYLIKLGGKHQVKDHNKARDADGMGSPAAMSPNALRGQNDMPGDSDSEEHAAPDAGLNWGKDNRRSQRRTLKQILEAGGRRGAVEEADSDKEIEEFLQKVIE